MQASKNPANPSLLPLRFVRRQTLRRRAGASPHVPFRGQLFTADTRTGDDRDRSGFTAPTNTPTVLKSRCT